MCGACGFWLLFGLGGAFLLRRYMQGGIYRKTNRIDGKVVLITGANTGIGKETALELAKRGGTIYLGCRDMQKANEARDAIIAESGNKKVYTRELDLSSLESVRQFAKLFKEEENKLDILINNAGIFNCPYSFTKEGFEMQIGVNHLGHFVLTNLLLESLKRAAPSRIVVVSSIGHKFGKIQIGDLHSKKKYDGMKAYSQSKLANVLFTQELAKRLEGTGVTINALHPGAIKTDIGRHVRLINHWFVQLLLTPLVWLLLKTTKNGAQTTVYAAIDPDLEKVSGKYFSDCALQNAGKVANDIQTAEWLWKESEALTKEKYT